MAEEPLTRDNPSVSKELIAKLYQIASEPITATKKVEESRDKLIERLAVEFPELDVDQIAADHKAQLEASGQLFQGRQFIDLVIESFSITRRFDLARTTDCKSVVHLEACTHTAILRNEFN